MSDIQDDFFGKYMAGDTKLPPPRDAAILFEEWRKQWLDLAWISVPTNDPTVLIEGYGDDEEFEVCKASGYPAMRSTNIHYRQRKMSILTADGRTSSEGMNVLRNWENLTSKPSTL